MLEDIKDKVVPMSIGLIVTIGMTAAAFGWHSKTQLGEIQERILVLRSDVTFLEKRIDILGSKLNEVDAQVGALKIQGATTGQGWLELRRRLDRLEDTKK